MSWRDWKGNNAQGQRGTVPTLDLHGKTKSQAMRAVTDFLEEQRQQHSKNHGHVCCILTGTGSHSAVGPVLRTAVGDLLRRRQMDFCRDTAGSFLVKAHTGWVFEERASTEQDSKVVVKATEDESVILHLANQRRQQKRAVAHSTTSHSSNGQCSSTAALAAPGPSLAEVARSDAEFRKAQDESRKMSQEQYKKEVRARKDLQRATALSIQETEQEEHAMHERIQEALQLSQQEASEREESDRLEEVKLQEQLQLAVRLSEKEAAQKQDLDKAMEGQDFDKMMQEAMQRSEQEASQREQDDRVLLESVMEESRASMKEELSGPELEEAIQAAMLLSQPNASCEDPFQRAKT